jgi:hypothetical protein
MLNCWYCGEELIDIGPQIRSGGQSWSPNARTIDHQIPRSLGGRTTPENIVSACPRCNSSKNGKTVEEYREYLYGKTPAGASVKHLQAALVGATDSQRHRIEDIIEEIRGYNPLPVFWGENGGDVCRTTKRPS